MVLIGSDSHSVQELETSFYLTKKYSIMFDKEINNALEFLNVKKG
ncbi:MAG: hypothetical protein QXU20_04910 [Candidatus Woesearchaeota archaeon]